MDCFSDESGKWQLPAAERHCLLIGGLCFDHAGIECGLVRELRIFQATEAPEWFTPPGSFPPSVIAAILSQYRSGAV